MPLGCNVMRQPHSADGESQLPWKQNVKRLFNFDFTLLSNYVYILFFIKNVWAFLYTSLIFFLKWLLVMQRSLRIKSLTVKNMHRHTSTLCVRRIALWNKIFIFSFKKVKLIRKKLTWYTPESLGRAFCNRRNEVEVSPFSVMTCYVIINFN